MPNDPKWRTIARVTGQPIPSVISVYIHLLVNASGSEKRGRTQPNAEDIATALDVSEDSVTSILGAMQGRVLDGDTVTGWVKRQPAREDNSAERAKEWRERNRTQPNAKEHRIDKEKNREEKKIQEHLPGASFELQAVGSQTVPIYREQIERWQDLYPAIDVNSELRKIVAWLESNPSKRKTVRGMMAFVNSWLSRAQDRGGSPALFTTGGTNGKPNANYDELIARADARAEKFRANSGNPR